MIEAPYRWEQPLQSSARYLVWLLVGAVVAALIWAALAQVRVYAPVQGTLAPRTPPVQVNAPSSGRVVESRVQLWQKVKKGDVLYVVDALARDAQDAQLQLQMSRNTDQEAQASIAVAQAEYQASLSEENRTRLLYNMGAIPRVELERAQTAARTARAQLERAEARAGTTSTQLQVQSRNQRIPVRAPIDGQIMQLADLHTGQMLSAGQGGVQILPEGVPLVFKGTAAEQDRPKLRTGARVQIAWNGYPRQKYGLTTGTLTGVSPTSAAPQDAPPSPRPNALRYEIEVTLPQEHRPQIGNKPLLPGMAGEAQVQSNQKSVLRLFTDWVRGADPWNE